MRHRINITYLNHLRLLVHLTLVLPRCHFSTTAAAAIPIMSSSTTPPAAAASTTKPSPGFFTESVSESYDARNRNLAPIGDNLHFLIRLVLQDLPETSRILCVGVGTGAEILPLAKQFPKWQFVGLDPSEPMLKVCQQRLTEAGCADRCKLIPGYVQDLPPKGEYDAVLSVLVAHFIPRKDRAEYFNTMTSQLKEGGILVNAEISYDLQQSDRTDAMITQWKKIQQLMGANAEGLANVPKMLREILTVLPPSETEQLIKDSGIKTPAVFYQAFMIHAWSGQK